MGPEMRAVRATLTTREAAETSDEDTKRPPREQQKEEETGALRMAPAPAIAYLHPQGRHHGSESNPSTRAEDEAPRFTT